MKMNQQKAVMTTYYREREKGIHMVFIDVENAFNKVLRKEYKWNMTKGS